jgi:dTDP-4-amino-4,6-dideoxygalactose transaminase
VGLAEASGAEFSVVVSSGTAALHAAYFAVGLKAGDEIVTSPLTFAATANAALYLGATVRFVDITPDTGTLDPALLASAITDRTRLIVPIDYGGHPADYDPIREVANQHGLTVVADSAHSLGATYPGQRIGELADAAVASFHPVKPITTAEGGAVLTSSQPFAARARRFRNHGIDPGPSKTQELEGGWFQEMLDLGFNYRLSDVHCALGLSQLRRLGSFLARRREIAARYVDALSDLDQLILPPEQKGVRSGWHLFIVQVSGEKKRRRPFFDWLRSHGLGVQVHYIPVYWHPYYQGLGFRKGLCPHAEDRYERSISLPIFPAMTDADIDLVIDRVRQAVREVL